MKIGKTNVLLEQKLKYFLKDLSREELVIIAKSWGGHEGVNYETTENEDLILLIIDAITLI